jgi:hypothetical protein
MKKYLKNKLFFNFYRIWYLNGGPLEICKNVDKCPNKDQIDEGGRLKAESEKWEAEGNIYNMLLSFRQCLFL